MIIRTEPESDLMKLFMDEFMKQANRIHTQGIKVKFSDQEREFTFHCAPIYVAADSVARPILQNRLQFNGDCGSSNCYQGGQHGKNKGIKYPF